MPELNGSQSSDPVGGKQSVEDELKRPGWLAKALQVACGLAHWRPLKRHPVNSNDSVKETCSRLKMASPFGQANGAGTSNEASRSRHTDAVIHDPSHHCEALENDSEQNGIDPGHLEGFISSGMGNPTFECIFMLCHVRSNNREDFDKHLLRDHRDFFRGSGASKSHTRLNAAALEVYFGGNIPSFAQEFFDRAFRTAVLGSRTPVTISRPRDEVERSSVTIDTFAIPFKGQNLNGRR